jgi:putative phosphoribosyl transferase
MVFEDREGAGKRLALALVHYRDNRPIILALPRGGIPIGFEIAESFHLPLEVLVAHKIGSPDNPEYGIGAIAEGNIRVLDERTIKFFGVSKNELDEIIKKEKEELRRRIGLYRKNKTLPSFKKRTVILVDDGLATGITARAAIAFIKRKKPKQLIFASPVCAYSTAYEMQHLVDDVVCLATPVDFSLLGFGIKNLRK